MNFQRLIPLEQSGQPSIRRIPVNMAQVMVIMPTDTPGRSLLAMAGGMQIVVCHTELELLNMVEGKNVIEEVDA